MAYTARDTERQGEVAVVMRGREGVGKGVLKFNVLDVPQTAALADQKAHTRLGVDRLIEIVAYDGRLPAAHSVYPNVAVTAGDENGGRCALLPELTGYLDRLERLGLGRPA